MIGASKGARALAGRGWSFRCPWLALQQSPADCRLHALQASAQASSRAAGDCGLCATSSGRRWQHSAADRPPGGSLPTTTPPVPPIADVMLEPEASGDGSTSSSSKAPSAVVKKPVQLVPKVKSTSPTAVREFDLKQSFQKFPFRREVQLGIMKMGVSVPTRVQDLTIPKLLENLSVFMLAQTGTGKTLAYVLPIVHKLLDNNAEGFYPMSKKPRAIIVQPTRELAMQTIKVVRNFPVQSLVCAPGCSFIKETQALQAGVDIVVTTPFRILIHLGKENMFLHQVRHLVFDEADTLCDTFYENDSKKLLWGLQKDASVQPQVIIVGATRTGAVSTFLKKHMSETSVLPIVSDDAHMTPPQVEQVFQPTKGKRRLAVLWDVLHEVPAIGKKTLIFTNRVRECQTVHKALLDHGYNAVAMHGNVHFKKRQEVWSDFNGTAADVMVTTNLASRGLDFKNVHHVVMFDFPLNLADYLHRVGRTARGGRAGRVTTITPRRHWPFVTKIQEAAREGRPIDVRSSTKKVRKLLALESYQRVMTGKTMRPWQLRRIRKKLGLPPSAHLGSPELKKAMKHIIRQASAVKHLRFLQSRGVLRKGHGLPARLNMRVENTEAQSVSTLVRARDGLLQVIPRRRKQEIEGASRAGPGEGQAFFSPFSRDQQSEPRGQKSRRSKPVM
eukprot:TRINITY_DN80853_c0_g1_i1.p1 TRINITY_DN80853_c0_g1~~TRINITY_DN80853_c0_g1_i1.p1  ORF type:complete len:672 (-),score=118.29 TRINITY_DN80853_c0_g1_i1:67-2082(-)